MIKMTMICMLAFSLLCPVTGNKIETELEEFPALGYSYGLLVSGDNYICYRDILALENDIYCIENGSYVKSDETLCDMLGVEGQYYNYEFRQYNNLIVIYDNEKFMLYDMDTNLSLNYIIQDDNESDNIINWYLYNGYIYYRKNPLDEIRRVCMSDGKEQVIYSGKKDDGMKIREFALRDDGKILCEWWSDSKREYYLIEICDNGEWKEEKIWETDGDRWKYVSWYAFNQYGLFQDVDFYDKPGGESVIIKMNGTVENFCIETKGRCNLYLNTGCLVSCIPYSQKMLAEDKTHTLNRRASGVIFYDYSGNVKQTHQLVDPAILQEGYYMRTLLYYEGKITAIYAQENTKELYIVQIEVEGLE